MNLLKKLFLIPRELNDADIPLLSASLAFSTLLSLIPFLAVGFAVVHLITGIDSIGVKVGNYLLSILAETAGVDIAPLLNKVLIRLSKTSWTVTSGLVLIATSLRLFLNLETAINRIWHTRNDRPFHRRVILVSIFYVTIPLGLSVYGGLRSADLMKPLFAWNPSFFDGAVAFVILLMMNRNFPSGNVRWRNAIAGASASSAGLFFLKEIFSWLTKTVFNYSKLYGSLAAMPLLCILILMTWQMVLAGVALAAALQSPVTRRRL